jgi:polyisoprenoid-binding protein YceI
MAKTKWSLDPTHSELGFKIKHLMITNVSGLFKDFNVEAEAENGDFSTAKINVTAKMDSIYTNNDQRDAHLRNADFFEVEKYPELKFESTRIQKVDNDNFVLYGDLTLKGITKSVKLNVEYSIVT